MARRRHDFYPTEQDLANAITRRVARTFPNVERVVEPTAGAGPFVRAAREVWPHAKIVAIDVLDARDDGGSNRADCLAAGADKFWHADVLMIGGNFRAAPPGTLFLGNPPFNLAAKIVKSIRENAPDGCPIAFLLTVGFAGRTQERNAEFWKLAEHAYHAPLHPRPSFSGDGKTDRMEYALYGFGKLAWLGYDYASYGMLDEPIVYTPEPGERSR
jgi:hypothetical protein